MKTKERKIIIAGFLVIIVGLAIINIVDFHFLEFYAMVVMMVFFLKYILIINE